MFQNSVKKELWKEFGGYWVNFYKRFYIKICYVCLVSKHNFIQCIYIALTCTETSFAVSERLCLALKSSELTWNWPAELIKELQELPNS